MRKLLGLAAVALIAGAGVAAAQETPRKGGTIRMTAPYAASFGSLDPHTSGPGSAVAIYHRLDKPTGTAAAFEPNGTDATVEATCAGLLDEEPA